LPPSINHPGAERPQPGDGQLGERDHGRGSRPLDLQRQRDRDILVGVLNPRLEQPEISLGQFADASNRVLLAAQRQLVAPNHGVVAIEGRAAERLLEPDSASRDLYLKVYSATSPPQACSASIPSLYRFPGRLQGMQ
jgi:hypothetical protein